MPRGFKYNLPVVHRRELHRKVRLPTTAANANRDGGDSSDTMHQRAKQRAVCCWSVSGSGILCAVHQSGYGGMPRTVHVSVKPDALSAGLRQPVTAGTTQTHRQGA